MSFHFNIDDASFAEAAQRLGVVRIGGRCDGFGGKSRGEIVETPDGARCWLKLVGWDGGSTGALADGEIDPVQPVGVAKPLVIRTEQWTQRDTAWRAILMTLAPSPAVESTGWSPPKVNALPDLWLTQLRNTLGTLRNARTHRMLFTPEATRACLLHWFGYHAPSDDTIEWTVCHGDLTWSNLTAPTLTLLDWEHWGLAPCGYDVARLICCSLHEPDMINRLQSAFKDDLNSPSGDVAILMAIAVLLGEAGQYFDAKHKQTLERIAQRIVGQPTWLRGRWLGRTAPLLPSRRRWPVSAAELASSNP